ncbi:MAG: pyridine nucleotide-disulfide oxidoreductase [Desulfobacteraceae bacterium 4572_35.2]|nr:MAG: pyridine nucleotide-disulfide oxidoreductase [Desulfobacteraceae bacterium 4572_35.2]
MNSTDIAVIGGSAAGLAAVAGLLRRHPNKKITMIRDVSQTVVPCGIPYVYGTLKTVSKNIIPDTMMEQAGVNIIKKHVNKLDRKTKIITFDDGETLSYEKMILSTGSKPFVPPIPGATLDNVFCIQKDPAYLQCIYDALHPASNIVVIGGGFIGVEMAEQIAKMADHSTAKNIRLVEMMPRCLMLACEDEFCLIAEKELEAEGVQVMTNSQVKAIHGETKVTEVELANGERLAADVVVIGIGAAPNIDLAVDAGLTADPRNGVKPRKTLGALGAFATKVGKRSIAAAGLTTQAAKQENVEVIVGEAIASNMHPASLPNAIADMKVKLLFRKDNQQIVGGHVCGGDSSAELANAISVAIQAKQTAHDLSVMQYATHPLLTASPVMYQLMVAADNALAATDQ